MQRYIEHSVPYRIGYDYYCDIADRIVSLRKEKGMRQTDLAQKSGMSVGTIANIEMVKKRIWLDDCEKIAKALDVEIDYLIGASLSSEGKECLYLIWLEKAADLKIYIRATSREMAYFKWHQALSRSVRIMEARDRAFVQLVGVPVSENEMKARFRKKICSDDDTLEENEE